MRAAAYAENKAGGLDGGKIVVDFLQRGGQSQPGHGLRLPVGLRWRDRHRLHTERLGQGPRSTPSCSPPASCEQHSHWHPGRRNAPGYREQCRQLTQARAEYPSLAAGSQTVQQQALRDFAQAMAAFFDPENPAGRPSWRKAGRDEGFRTVGRGSQWDVRRVSRKAGRRPG